MTVQFIGAGLIAGALLDVDFAVAVLILGGLMTLYTVLGGMVAATYIQIFKTSLLAVMVLAVFVAVIKRTGWNPIGPMLDASDTFGKKIVEPDRSDMTASINSLSLTIGLTLGIMGLPHVMLRFLTVRDARAARNSAGVAISIFMVFFLLLPIFGYAALNEIGKKAIVAANPAGNSAGPMLAEKVGGDVLYALVAGVTIATILAVLAGMAIAVSGAVAHDLYTNVIKKGHVDERGQLISGRLAGAIAACIAIGLAFGAKDLNIANVANIAFAIAASTTMPTLLLTIYWRRFNQTGALAAMIGGLTVSLVLVILGPDVMGKADAIWPLAIPAIVSVPAGFLFAYLGTMIGAGRVGSTGMPYDEFESRAFAPDEDSAQGGRFTRRADEPERVGAA
jgi:Na+(H+)/acetate symporter ActP